MAQKPSYKLLKMSSPTVYKTFAPDRKGAEVSTLIQALAKENGPFWQKREAILTPAKPTVNPFFLFLS